MSIVRILNAESSTLGAKESEWRIFLGAEAGVGLFASDSALFVGINSVALNRFPMGIGYSVGVMGGLQKYTYEDIHLVISFLTYQTQLLLEIKLWMRFAFLIAMINK